MPLSEEYKERSWKIHGVFTISFESGSSVSTISCEITISGCVVQGLYTCNLNFAWSGKFTTIKTAIPQFHSLRIYNQSVYSKWQSDCKSANPQEPLMPRSSRYATIITSRLISSSRSSHQDIHGFPSFFLSSLLFKDLLSLHFCLSGSHLSDALERASKSRSCTHPDHAFILN